MSESQQQATVIDYFRAKYSGQLIFAIPNGTHIKSYAGRSKASKEGLTAGIPDLMIASARGGYHGLFIEMKDVKKTKCSLTKQQELKIFELNNLGYKAVWCAGADAAIDIIDNYMRKK